jgi:type II secretory pathway predicted ATPase ExeA
VAAVPPQSQPDALTYEPYFGLSEKAFSLNADGRFIYESQAYLATGAALLAGIRRREGLLVLTGQIGAGKTTLCRAVLGDLGRNTYSSLVPDPFASREDLLKMLLIDFGVLSIQELTTGALRQASRTELAYLLSEFIESLTRDAFVVVVIDEAQNLALPLIEETRLLSDTLGARGKLQIVFVGQPELHAKLKSPEMRQVDQRVCGYHRLEPMGGDAIAGYIEHRMQVAGSRNSRALFPAEIIDHLHARTGGLPRLINRICDRALLLAYERRAEHVNREILDAALGEVGSATLSPTWDSIVFAAPPAAAPPVAAPAPTPVPASAPVAAPTPAIDPWDTSSPDEDQETFKKEIERWVTQDLAPSSRPLIAEPRRASTTVANNVPPQERRPRTSSFSRTRSPHTETYAQRLWRRWTMRAGIAFAVFLGANLVLIGASLLPGVLPLGELPAGPAAPAPTLPAALELAQAPAADAPIAAAASAVQSADYFVAVGVFADQNRADRLVDTLTHAGMPAMQRQVARRGQQLQQIVLGPFFSRADALADLRRLQQLGGYADAAVINAGREPSAQ